MGKYKYRTLKEIKYYSKRYDKWITVPVGDLSDGATGAVDISGPVLVKEIATGYLKKASLGWVVHDELCEKGHWDDGTPLTNWQCSQVLQDILANEGRTYRKRYWFWMTFLFGGGNARANGMIYLKR